MRDTKKKTRKIINRIRAIPAAVPAMSVKPNRPAISATIKNVIVQFNMKSLSQLPVSFAQEAYCTMNANVGRSGIREIPKTLKIRPMQNAQSVPLQLQIASWGLPRGDGFAEAQKTGFCSDSAAERVCPPLFEEESATRFAKRLARSTTLRRG